MRKILISEDELSRFTKERDIASRAKALLDFQMAGWDFLKQNYNNLKNVITKKFEFDGFNIIIQNNPDRIISTTADVSSYNNTAQNSFFHHKNLPEGQKSIRYYKDYLILCNPYPIFPEHFTIPSVVQKPQSIFEHIKDFLFLSRDMQKYYLILYNGAKCGASIPGHLHFQAGNKNFLPIDGEYENIKQFHSRNISFNKNLQLYFCSNYLRNFISIESGSVIELEKGFKLIYSILQKSYDFREEPLINVLLYYLNNQWRIILFPRDKHRPTYYFKEGERQIIVSPGAVDMGGILIIPRKEDFEKITKEIIIDIYRQVSISKEIMEFVMIKALNAQKTMSA